MHSDPSPEAQSQIPNALRDTKGAKETWRDITPMAAGYLSSLFLA